MGLFNKLFSSSNQTSAADSSHAAHGEDNKPKQRSRSSSVSINNILKKDNPSNNFDKNTKQNEDISPSLPHLKKAMTTGDFPTNRIDMKQFLDYWKNENLILFHSKDNLDCLENPLKTKQPTMQNIRGARTLKSCFKKGTLLEHKRRLLMCQKSHCKPPSIKAKSNIAKLFLSKSSSSSSSSENPSPTSTGFIPLRKWSSQPVLNVDKECEYDMLGMQDYYDNESHPAGRSSSSRSSSNTSPITSESDLEDDDSDTESLKMPVISPITSNDTFSHEAHLNEFSELKVPPGLENVNIPKHIHFDKSIFTIDPPQQICSKQPRVGEVEVQNGCVIVHNNNKSSEGLSCKDIDGVGKGSHGLTVGGRGVLKILSQEERDNLETSLEWRYFKDLENMNKNGRTNIKLDEEEQEKVDEEKQFLSEDDMFPDSSRRVSWRMIYQRVCHLREILPIASVMQQIPEEEGTNDNGEPNVFIDFIPMITLKNNKPSLIEILTICDFISCSIIESLSFDMCDLSVDMLSRILDAVSRMILNIQTSEKSDILSSVKLSFRNAPIDDEGWIIFCKFLSNFNFKNLKLSLDISLAPGVKCNVLRKKNIHCANDKVKRMSMLLHRNQSKDITELNDFDYDMISRNRDWPLFIASIACNTSLRFQQLFLNNCRIFNCNKENYGFIVQNFFESVGVKTIELGASKADIQDLFDVAIKSKNNDPDGLPENKIEKCEILSKSLLQKFDNQGLTKFNIRDLLIENNILDQPHLPVPHVSCNAGKRNILIDHALLDNVDGDGGRSFSLRGEEDEIIPIFSKSDSSADLDKEFGSSIKGSHDDLMKLKSSSIRDMINH